MKTVQICFSPYPHFGGPAINYRQFHEALDAVSVGFSKWPEFSVLGTVIPCELNLRSGKGPLASRYYHVGPEDRARVTALLDGADMVLLHGFYMGPFAWICDFCIKKGIPYGIIPHGIFDPWAEKKSRVMKRVWMALYGRRILSKAAFVLCSSRGEALKVSGFFPGARVEVLHWGCPEIPAPQRTREEVRSELGLQPHERLYFSIGRLHPMKRPVELARAFVKATPSHHRLLFVGPEEGAGAEQILAGMGPSEWARVCVLPPLFGPGKFDYFAAADFYVSASHRENFNFTAVEALGSGLPCLLSPGNDLRGELEGQPFVMPLDPPLEESLRLLAAKIDGMDESHRRALGAQASDWVVRNLSRDSFDHGIRELVRRHVRVSTSRPCP